MGKRERWGALAGAILLTVALPIAIDQGYFRYNPYVLPALGAAAVVLYAGFVLTAQTPKRLLTRLISWRLIMGPVICIGLFAVGGAMLGTAYWLVLRVSKQHITELKAREAATSPPPHEGPAPFNNGVPPVSQVAPTLAPAKNPESGHEITNDPVGALSRLGWTVKRDGKLIQFEIANSPLPDMAKSAIYFKEIQEPFRLRFQSVPNLSGLDRLSALERCQEIGVSASELTNIKELGGFVHLKRMEITQVPLNTRSDIDSAPLGSLVNLTSLALNGSRISEIKPIAKMPQLDRLIIESTLIRDLSAVRSTRKLKVLDVRESNVTDISAAAANLELEELVIDTKQVANLGALSSLRNLYKLTVIGQQAADLSPLGELRNLKSLFVWGMPSMNLGFLKKLPNLVNLQLSGFGIPVGPRSLVTDSSAICTSSNLKTLTLGALEIRDLAFAPQCKALTEINLRDIPVSSLNDLASVSTLRKISLVDISIVEISPLLEMPNLEALSLIRVPARADVVSALERKGVKVENP